jgi:predicted flap endonuclease-1-like 5' DNA nuclease
MKELGGNDPRVKAVARQLEITVILRAWEEDGTLYIQDPWDTHSWDVPAEVAGIQEGRDDTLPKTPTSTAQAGRAARRPPAPTGIDDFTAITGVGPKTAQKLHDLGLFTYDDLREWIEVAEEVEGITDHTIGQIEAWLQDFLA